MKQNSAKKIVTRNNVVVSTADVMNMAVELMNVSAFVSTCAQASRADSPLSWTLRDAAKRLDRVVEDIRNRTTEVLDQVGK